MKYVLNILFFFASILFLSLIIYDNKSKILPTVLLDNDTEYQIYTIYTDNLTTNNLYKYFSSTDEFYQVYPKINSIYKYKLGKIYFECTNKFNIEEFTNYYKNILEKNNYKFDLVNIDYYGITIEKIKLYSNKDKINKILEKCSLCSI